MGALGIQKKHLFLWKLYIELALPIDGNNNIDVSSTSGLYITYS